MTKLVYIISQGHSGSTLADCILGTHPDFISSGEMKYLGWQLERTKNSPGSLKEETICTCGKDFRQCPFWSDVVKRIKLKTGIDMNLAPSAFNMHYFRQFAYQNLSSIKPSFPDKVKARLFRKWIGAGHSYKKLSWLEPSVDQWLQNNWILYESMTEAANKPIVVDSSKHLTIALLLQQYQLVNVHIVFLQRSPEGLAASYKKWAQRKGSSFNLPLVISRLRKYQAMISQCQASVKGLNFINVQYEEMVKHPADFLHNCVEMAGADPSYKAQVNNAFFIDPSASHMVAGNPMRYRGRQQVISDERWKTELTDKELEYIASHIYA